MANERAVLCGSVPETGLPVGGGPPLRLRLWGRHRNIKLEINDISRAMMANLPPAFIDLLEIATYVYCADQAVTRGGDGVDNLGADWRRRMFFRIPVRAHDLWAGEGARNMLATTLGFLSEDEYIFEFTALSEGPSVQQYLFSRDDVASEKIEEVVLFSGGLDSLAGAVRECVVDRHQVALVTHQSSKKLARRYGKLQEQLRARSGYPPLFVPVTINKKKNLGREYTQRSRSFLYVALAATVAQMIGLSRIRFYENGVVSFNFPPLGQIVGARATRTTHPQTLRGFGQILTHVAGRRFDVDNPFLWLTKADVVQQIVNADCAEMIKFSTSCTHTWETTKLHPHCGACSQCIDRRFAVLAVDASNADPEEAYKIRLLVDERDEGEPRSMLAAYVETAGEVARMTPVTFFSRFGEASRILRHLNESPDVAALKIFELHKRHAGQIIRVVDQAIAAHAKEIRERTLPAACLLRLVCDATAASATHADTSKEERASDALPTNMFRKKAEQAWEVRFAGGPDFILLRSKGAAYLHILLSNPRVPISTAKLAATVARQPEEYFLGNAGEGSDPEAMTAYLALYQELERDLEEALHDNDAARQMRLREEMDDLLNQIERDRGLGGRLRKAADNRERVRKAVGIAIRRALKEIAANDRRLTAHLQPPTLRCGLNPCYNPPAPIEWET